MKAADFFDPELLTEVTREMWPFRSQIADREAVLAALALSRQHRVAAANARLDRVFMDGIGEVVASIDADVYHRLGLLYGYETVNSDDFLKSLLRDNPEVRVKSRSRHTRIVVPGGYREEAVDCGSRIADCGLGAEVAELSADVCTAAAELGELRDEEDADEEVPR